MVKIQSILELVCGGEGMAEITAHVLIGSGFLFLTPQ